MTLKEAFSEHLVAGQQGQLVIKFAGDVHLCKILVEDGRAVHIAHGRMSPEEILGTLAMKSVEWVNFIAGYPVRKKLDFPLHENLISAVSNQAAPAPVTPAPVAPAAPTLVEPAPDPAAFAGPTIDADKITTVVEAFIELVGPLGTILAEQASTAVNYTDGTPMPQTSYNSFIQALAAEVPDEDRDAFVEQHKL
jgi:hypothetical protein